MAERGEKSTVKEANSRTNISKDEGKCQQKERNLGSSRDFHDQRKSQGKEEVLNIGRSQSKDRIPK